MPITPLNYKTDYKKFSTYPYIYFYTVYNLRALGEGIKDIIKIIDFRGHYNIYKNML